MGKLSVRESAINNRSNTLSFPMSAVPPSTLAAYHETDYCVFGEPPLVLRIGIASEALAGLYRKHGVECAAFVTACNPFSENIGKEANATKQAELKNELQRRSLVFYEGEGRHPDGGWPAEPSFLVMGFTLESAKSLGTRHEQNAVVWCGTDVVPQLVLLR